jgi:hypothetical protein
MYSFSLSNYIESLVVYIYIYIYIYILYLYSHNFASLNIQVFSNNIIEETSELLRLWNLHMIGNLKTMKLNISET